METCCAISFDATGDRPSGPVTLHPEDQPLAMLTGIDQDKAASSHPGFFLKPR